MIYIEIIQTVLLIWILFSLGKIGQLVQICFTGHEEIKALKIENKKLKQTLYENKIKF